MIFIIFSPIYFIFRIYSYSKKYFVYYCYPNFILFFNKLL